MAKFHLTEFAICSHSRERKTLSYSQINNVNFHHINQETGKLNYFFDLKIIFITFMQNQLFSSLFLFQSVPAPEMAAVIVKGNS